MNPISTTAAGLAAGIAKFDSASQRIVSAKWTDNRAPIR